MTERAEIIERLRGMADTAEDRSRRAATLHEQDEARKALPVLTEAIALLERDEEALRKLLELRDWCRKAAKCPDEEEPGRADAYRIVAGTSFWDPAVAALAETEEAGK